jgi:O-antigen/teichoic acid export membrane protein
VSGKTSHADQAGILVLGRVLASLAEGLVLLVIVRLLGKPEVGVLSALLLVYQTVALIMTAGFPAAVMYALPARPITERRAIAWRFTSILVGLGMGAAVLLMAIGWIDHTYPEVFGAFKDTEATGTTPSFRYLMLLAIFPLSDLPARILPNLLVIEDRARAAAGVSIVKSLGMSLATVLPLAMGMDLWAVVIAIDIYGLLYGALLVSYLVRCYRGVERVPAPMGIREIFKFAIPLGLTDIVSVVNNRIDRYLILVTMTVAVFAEYQVGAWQIPFVVTIPYAVGAAYTPRFRELFKDGRFREGIAIWRLSITKVSLVVAPITAVFIVAAEETIALLFTDEYSAATVVFRLYCVFTLGRVAAFGSVIVAAGKPGYVLKAAFFSLLSNIAISVPLVLLIGFPGPALGTAIAFIPTVGFYCWCIARSCGISIKETFPLLSYLRVLGVAAMAAVPAVAVKLMLDLEPGWMLGLEALTLLVTYAVLGTLLKLIEPQDWSYLRRWFSLRLGTPE